MLRIVPFPPCIPPTRGGLFKILTTPMVWTAIIEYAHDCQELVKAKQCLIKWRQYFYYYL